MKTILLAIALVFGAPETEPEPHHFLPGLQFVLVMNARADLPYEYGWYTYRAALEEDVDPLELGAVLISEESGPDVDFSVQGALARSYEYDDWDPDSLGSSKERGLFQIKPRWVWSINKHRGTDYVKDDLFDPEVNARVAAYVVARAKESHKEHCIGRRFNYHESFVAHWKCAREDRDNIDPKNFCRFKQKKYEKLLISLSAFFSPDFNAIGKAHNQRMKKLKKRHERWVNRKTRRALRKLRKLRKKSKT